MHISQLPIKGYNDQPVPNTFLSHEQASDHAAIFLPGDGYTCDMPLLYYSSSELFSRGADALKIAYSQHKNFSSLTSAEIGECVVSDAEAAVRTLLQTHPYHKLTIVGKSRGTWAMGHLLTSGLPLPEQTRTIWLTPMLNRDLLRDQIARIQQHSLFVIGTSDPHYNPDVLHTIREHEHHKVITIEGANHGLEISGNVLQSIQIIERVIHAIQTFV
ncbi:MAG: hypothetical protein J2P36_05015 [Ktedonobacteraceae bacterium]|nr:hypothetical protein [Ktedonobacteraceae bacterium]